MKMMMILKISAALLLTLLWVAIPAYATGNQNHECQGGHNCNNEGGPVTVDQDQGQHQGQAQGQEQGQSMEQGQEQAATADAQSSSASDSAANNEGIDTDVTVEGDTSNVENNSSNIVLVPNNNTENCLRVIGLAFGRNGESAAFGWPYRSKKCDYEGAADDAFAAGEREIGWFWKCENPNLYKTFKGKGESKESAKGDCFTKMVGGVTAIRTINTLKEQLTMVNSERTIERTKAKESRERLTAACNESKDRILEACVNK
jgi:hypothetical protein